MSSTSSAKFFIHDEWNLMFRDSDFWNLTEDLLKLMHIKKAFSSYENLSKVEDFIHDRIDEFVSGDISRRYKLLSYEKQRSLIMNKLSDLYWNSGDILNERYAQFSAYKDTAPTHMLVLLWKLGYIRLYNATTDYLT